MVSMYPDLLDSGLTILLVALVIVIATFFSPSLLHTILACTLREFDLLCGR